MSDEERFDGERKGRAELASPDGVVQPYDLAEWNCKLEGVL